jgi:hypothetical protein
MFVPISPALIKNEINIATATICVYEISELVLIKYNIRIEIKK